MCGIVGVVGNEHVNQLIYDALTVLQHRGQDAAGIVTCEGDRLHLRKANGLVRDVFHTRHMLNLKGHSGLVIFVTPPRVAHRRPRRNRFMSTPLTELPSPITATSSTPTR